MSKHSKWAKVKHQKGGADVARGNLFTKLANTIAVATRGGVNPDVNFQLRLAILRARAASMPKENIERAVARGSGAAGATAIEEVLYEGFGPGGVAILVQAATDNKNRAYGDIKTVFSKNGGSLGSAGSVAWMFDRVGEIAAFPATLASEAKQSRDALELVAIDAGATDVREEDDELVVVTAPNDLQKVKEALEASGATVSDAGLSYIPKTRTTLTDPDAKTRLDALLEALDALDDVNDFWTNAV